jgi:hypothetical protein
MTHKHRRKTMSFDTPKLPEIKFSKNGYEIRTEILGMAKDLIQSEYAMKFHGWEVQQYKDEKTGQMIAKVGMPEFPGLEKVLETAEKMYAFVNQSTKK